MDRVILTGSVIGEERVLSIEELASACRVEASWVIELVAEGVLAPQGMEIAEWRFGAADLRCARRIARLQRDFGASIEVAAVMLDLIEEIQELRARLTRAGLDMD